MNQNIPRDRVYFNDMNKMKFTSFVSYGNSKGETCYIDNSFEIIDDSEIITMLLTGQINNPSLTKILQRRN